MWGDCAQPLARAHGPAGLLGQIWLGHVGSPCLAFSVRAAGRKGGAEAGWEASADGRGAGNQGTRLPGEQPGVACECRSRTDGLAWAAARGRGGVARMHSLLRSDLPAPSIHLDVTPTRQLVSPREQGKLSEPRSLGVKLVVGALGASPHVRTAPLTAAASLLLHQPPSRAGLS